LPPVKESAHEMSEEFDHRDALAALSATELAAFKETRDAPGLVHLAGHLILLCVTGSLVLWTANPALKLLAMALHGIAVVSLFALEHESIHGTAFRSQWINMTVAEICGFLLLLPPRYFRFFHFDHHRHTQDRLRDPELATPRPANAWQYAWHLTGLPYWGAQAKALVTNAIGRKVPLFVPPSAYPKIVAEARLHLLGYALVALLSIGFGRGEALWLWVIPALLGQPFLRAYLLAEHAACPLIANMLANTRTTFTNRAIRLLAWNMPHHTAHHALPTVPFHRLPALTALLDRHLRSRADSYLDAHRQIRRMWKET
jgi:fatty acid desaturase